MSREFRGLWWTRTAYPRLSRFVPTALLTFARLSLCLILRLDPAQILAEEQAGLAHLTKILQKDMKDVAVIYGEGDAQPDESASSPQGRTELMSSFSQTLRASSLG